MAGYLPRMCVIGIHITDFSFADIIIYPHILSVGYDVKEPTDQAFML